MNSVKHYAKGNAKVLPAGYSNSTYFVETPWFNKFMARKDLVALVNKKLSAG